MPLPPIIFEDDALVVFDKPGDMLVTPDPLDRKRESLMPLIRARFGDGAANIHRLDTEVSGLFLCAKTKPAQDFLSGQFQAKTAGKIYHALGVPLPAERAWKSLASLRDASGALPAAFSVGLPLGHDPNQPGRMQVVKDRDAKDTVTEFSVLERFDRFAWIECRPLTSLMHQIRVHLAAAGMPVVNDLLYGEPGVQLLLSDLKRRYKGREVEKPLVSRLVLHASELRLIHPVSRQPFTVAAPLPHEFEVALKYLRKFAIVRR